MLEDPGQNTQRVPRGSSAAWLKGARLAEQVALNFVDPEGRQHLELRFGFGTFGNDPEIQVVPERDDRADHCERRALLLGAAEVEVRIKA